MHIQQRIPALVASIVALGALTQDVVGQAGDGKDRPGTVQQMRVPEELIPDAPILSPEQALQSFTVVPGFEVQIAAAEPLVNSPVAMEFDHLGRMWVVEMTGYMPNVEGEGEDQRVGSVVTLEDTDGDGRMDKRTVFLDNLQMPRALCLIDGGVLVAEPPYLWFCQDTDGDGKSDKREVVDENYGSQVNPEHTANALMVAMDNWIYSANHNVRYKRYRGRWLRESTISRGQWGMSQDNYGRIYYNSNSDQLRVDLFPSHYLDRNPGAGRLSGASFRTTADQTVWPIRVNPGVNRGYRADTLRDEDHTLASYTAASGPLIYRGNNLPEDFVDNGFIPEPSGNLIRRNILTEINGTVTAENAYFQSEFLASTDERFRPVNLYNGPDGALYIVDFYRGLIQHRIYLTTYLRQQIEERGLENPTDFGRIYRVIWKGRNSSAVPTTMDPSNSGQLVAYLGHPNGWVRDTAQRLLVEMGDKAPADRIRRAATKGRNALGRLHALWTLEGIEALTPEVLQTALGDWDAKVRATAVRLSEPFLLSSDPPSDLKSAVLSCTRDPAFEVRVQLAFSLGFMPAEDRAQPLAEMLLFGCENQWMQNAALSSMAGVEEEFLQIASADPAWNMQRSARTEFIKRSASSIANSRQGSRLLAAARMATRLPGSSRAMAEAILEGLTVPKGRDGKPAYIVQIDSRPDELFDLSERFPALKELLAAVSWEKDRDADSAVADVKPLSGEEQSRFDNGRQVYATLCGACHQPHGRGQDGLAPPLVDSEWVSGSKDRLIRIVLNGLQGPIEVNGTEYNLLMPGLSVLDDQQISSVLTFTRRSFGHTASPVSPEEVAAIRATTSPDQDLWTARELLNME